MGQLKQPSPSTKPTTHPMVLSLSCWFSALGGLSPSTSRPYQPIVTLPVPRDTPGFPAYSRLRTAPSPMRGAAPPACQGASYLRHCCYYRRTPYLSAFFVSGTVISAALLMSP